MFHKAIIQTPIGKLGIFTTDHLLTRLDFLTDDSALIAPNEEILDYIVSQLNQYFQYPSFQFNISYQLQGTPFQKKVWQTLSNLPIQKTVSYGMLAKKLKTGARAIGNACRANPLPILIPCHRVVAQGHFGGYKGKEISIKKWLLQHEFYSPTF
ncbi:MAG: methylated-DNA--[protein]-cysteine S-methyltransferase [Candidatus Aquirickettsiella sp.]